jgi:putative transposase
VIWGGQAYAGQFARWVAEERRWRLEVTYHRERHLWRYGLKEKPAGFVVIPRRWVVERTFAWLGQARRLSKDYHPTEVGWSGCRRRRRR